MLFSDFVSNNGVPRRPETQGPRRPPENARSASSIYIISCRKEEMVTADSTFAILLLRGLRGGADFFRQGLVSADQLGIYLSREVPKHSQRSQTPQFSPTSYAKLSEGQFFFLTGIVK